MRHGKRINHLGRTSSHRKAMLSNMASSLIIHKRLTTTVAKAKALRKYVEPLITRSKVDSTHSRRVVFSYLQDKDSSRVLFDEVSARVAERPGGYTRIIKLGNRLGDNAEMCMIELVDFNELYNAEEKQKQSRTRRSRRGGSKKSSESTTAAAAPAEAVVEEDTVQEAVVVEEEAAVEEAPSAEVTTEEETAQASETEPTDSTEETDDAEKPKE
ncbi:MAG: 50S ribosomal protein L17 [Cyclobacteriaceae bacterium]|jgi:large subunit ribosomal protein L17